MLSALVHIHSLRWMIPTTLLLSGSTIFITMWSAVRVATAVLPRRIYRKFDDDLYSTYQRYVLFFFYACTGVKVYTYGDSDQCFEKKENVIYICNHQCTVDWIIANMLAMKQGSLGHVRFVMKDGLKYFPLYGFYFKQHDCIYVQRSGKFNEQAMGRQLTRLKQRKEPVWMVIFPEGTRFNPELPHVIKKSKEFAKEQGLDILQNVLSPKGRAFEVCSRQLRGHVDAIYDVTIAFGDTVDPKTGHRITSPGVTEFLHGKSSELHLHMERIDIKEVPTDENKLKVWLHNQFVKKDRLMSHFYSKNEDEMGKFPGERKLLHFRHRETLPAALFYSSCFTLIMANSESRSWYWKVALYGSLAGCLWMSFRSQA